MITPAERVRDLADRRGEIGNRDAARALGVSAATAHRLLAALVAGGVLERHGKGPASRYRLRRILRRFRLSGLEEDRAWQEIAADVARIRPVTPDEALSLRYAATEVINNAVEHSRGSSVDVGVEFGSGDTLTATVRDRGVGVFRRLCEDFGFGSPQEAIVQLEKGKLTSDPASHSGEGLFFSSKAVTRFRLESRGIAWSVDNDVGDSGIGTSAIGAGTLVVLVIVRGRTPRLADVFGRYTDPETMRFAKTRATIRLTAHGTALVSRSEARRLLRDVTKFAHVTLDFSGVDIVGQGFCDEVFRVFERGHPEIVLEPAGMNEPTAFMVARARAT